MAQKKKRRGRRRHKRRSRNLALKIIIFFILLLGIVAALLLWKKYSPTKEKADLKAYYGIDKEDQPAIIINNYIVDTPGLISEGMIYVEYDVVRNYINKRFYWDANEELLLYTLPSDVVSVSAGSADYSVSKEKNTSNYVIVKTEGDTAYIALDFVKQYTDMEYEIYDEPGRVVVNSETGSVQTAELKSGSAIRTLGGVKSPILTEVSDTQEVRVIEETGSWTKVRTADGFIGYVKSKSLKNRSEKMIDRNFNAPEFTSIKKDYTINMAWANVISTDGNSTIIDLIGRSKGLTTVSPTWFHVVDTEGNIDSIAGTDVVDYAHQNGMEVWAAVRDFDGGINSFDESYELLRSTSARNNLVSQLISAALASDIDGINVDFEKISEECGDHYIQFIRELSVRCRQNGLVLSVDNYVPMSFNQQYHRDEQGVFADYVVIMGYDEHYNGSEEAGSVSSYDYVKNGIEQTMMEVPAEKIISGIPFYTRIWEESAGSGVTSEAYSMVDAASIVEKKGVEPTWDDETKQYYASWESNGSTFKIWMEDAKSIEAKLQLMKDNNLAGTAAWRLGQESADIWDVILQYVK